jgi:hypothetical protein
MYTILLQKCNVTVKDNLNTKPCGQKRATTPHPHDIKTWKYIDNQIWPSQCYQDQK